MYNLHPIEVTGKWSATEKALFDQAVAVYGWGNWQLFNIKGRSSIQVKVLIQVPNFFGIMFVVPSLFLSHHIVYTL